MSKVNTLEKQYQQIVQKHSPKNALLKNCWRAFWVGGVICAIGEIFTEWYKYMGYSMDDAAMLTTTTLIFISTVLTACNVYDNIGNYAGGGSVIPITGFANSMVSAAMEYKSEGLVYGLGAKLFNVAGPVIVYGTLSSVVVGLIYYFIK
jgi:stage V sporulation protein AC